MKVLIQMGDSYPDESPCAKRMRTFYEVFKENGDEVIVLAPQNSNSIMGTEGAVYCPTVPLKKKSAFYRFLNSFVLGMTSYFKSLRIKNVDVVVTTAPPPLINLWGKRIAKAHKAKLIYDVRDVWPDVAWEMGSFGPNSIYSKIFEYIRNNMLKSADLIITVSPGKVKKLKEYAPHKRVIEITNGLDESFLKNTENAGIVKKYKLDELFTVCYIGNLGLAQGLKQLLEIARLAQEEKISAQFLLFGSGAEEKLLREYAEQNDLLNVHFPGRIPNKLMFTVLKHSKISFVSLVNENLRDSVPTKMYEAVGAGCPVLLAACGDSVEILKKSGFGIAVKPNDQKALWNAFRTMHDDIKMFENRRVAALNYMIANYSRQNAARKFCEELHKLIGE